MGKTTIKVPVTRDQAIKTTLTFIKYQLKKRGDDPKSYNEKYLMTKAIEGVDGYFKLHGNYGIERLEEVETPDPTPPSEKEPGK
ncbi:MAG: hypothetical protein ACK58T_18380 [Phycisphaerae bacterium]|jgi:hypothetical protein